MELGFQGCGFQFLVQKDTTDAAPKKSAPLHLDAVGCGLISMTSEGEGESVAADVSKKLIKESSCVRLPFVGDLAFCSTEHGKHVKSALKIRIGQVTLCADRTFHVFATPPSATGLNATKALAWSVKPPSKTSATPNMKIEFVRRRITNLTTESGWVFLPHAELVREIAIELKVPRLVLDDAILSATEAAGQPETAGAAPPSKRRKKVGDQNNAKAASPIDRYFPALIRPQLPCEMNRQAIAEQKKASAAASALASESQSSESQEALREDENMGDTKIVAHLLR